MNFNKPRLKKLKEYDTNPFIKNLNVPITPKMQSFVSKDKAIINTTTGEIDDDVLLTGKRKFVDGEDFVKIFVKEMETIFDLNKSSQKVFTYMLSKIKYDDHFIFNMKECLEKTGYKSRTPIFNSLLELIQKKFIAKTQNQFVYWINPKLFYKGDRLVVIREYRKAKQDQIRNANQLDMFKKTEDEDIEKSTKRIKS